MTRGALVARALVTAQEAPPVAGAGRLRRIEDAGVAWDDDGVLVYAGAAEGLPWPAAFGSRDSGCIAPGFVDCHVHLPFVGWRADEFQARLSGLSYRDVAGEGGGIARSSRLLAAASDDDVLSFCLPIAAEMAAHGTTAMELKTGYGLSVEAELRQASLARRLSEAIPQTCTVTLLACHAVPPGMTRAGWVDVVCGELIPAAAAQGLADAIDVYVEDIAFDLHDLARVAEAAAAAGLPLRCHADQLGPSGAAQAAVDLGARSADHLNHVDEAGIDALGAGATAAVLLPASTFFLREGAPPAAALRDAGATIAVATDLNPGTSPVCSMPEAIAMACTIYGMDPQAAMVATTANPAWILGLHDRLGRIEPGMRADLVLLEEADVAQIPYRPGHDPVLATFVGGKRVFSADASGST
ncbi:MAG: imidazolonepropionase [Actinomycetota bacterium]